MKTEYTNNGWKEITTKIIRINNVSDKPFSTVKDWMTFNDKYPKIGRRRRYCNRCKTKWVNINENSDIYIIFTDKGNKIICEKCYEGIK